MLDCYKKLAEMKLRRIFWLHAGKNLLFAAVQIWLFHFFDCHLFSIMVFSNWYYSLRIDLLSRMELYEERYRTRDLPLKERLQNASFEAGMWRLLYGDLQKERHFFWVFYLLLAVFYKITLLFSEPLINRLVYLDSNLFMTIFYFVLQALFAVMMVYSNVGFNKIPLEVVERMQDDEDIVYGLDDCE